MRQILLIAVIALLVGESAPAQLSTVDRFNRAVTNDLSTSPPQFKWVKLLNQDTSVASFQINGDSTISTYNPLGAGHFGGVVWDSLVTDTSQAGLIVRQKGGNGINSTLFLYFRMNSKDGNGGNGYRMRYFDDPSGLDQIVIQRVNLGVNSTDLLTLQREIQVGDTLVVKVESDKTMKALVYGANGIRDSISVLDNTYNPSSWYWWLRGCVFTTPAKFTNFMMGKIPTISGTPLFGVAPSTLNFGAVAGGVSKLDSVTVQNTGTGPLHITSAATSNPDFVVSPMTSTVPPAGSVKFYVTFSPTRSGAITGSLVFNHNAVGSPGSIALSGSGSGSGFFYPLVTSIIPSAGPLGTNLTIVGKNFQSGVPVPRVRLGAVEAAVTARTDSALTLNVPAGTTYEPVTVLQNGLIARAEARYDVTFSSSHQLDSLSFSHAITLGAGVNPHQVQSIDIDDDGKPDLAELNGVSNTFSIYRNIGGGGTLTSGSFATPVNVSVGGAYPSSYTSTFAVGDLDNDGLQDIVIVDDNANQLVLLRNTSTVGSVSFAAPQIIGTGLSPDGVALGDLDGDGKLDIVAAVYGYQLITVFKNTGSPGAISFAPGIDFTTGSGPASIAIGDLDGDGRPDIVVGTILQGISLFRNTAVRGTFDGNSLASRIDLNPAGGGYAVALADIDGDGKSDIIQTTNVLSVYRNTSTLGLISFAPNVDLAAGSSLFALATGDLDGDGKPDIAVDGQSSNTITLYQNLNTPGSITAGGFVNRVDITAGNGPRFVSIGDLNADGKPELLVANEFDSTVTLYRNQLALLATCVITPTVDSIGLTPVGGNRIDSVTVTNTGTSSLTISTIVSDSAGFSISPGSGTISAGGTKKFYVTFTPQTTGTKSGTFRFIHTGSGSPALLTAVGQGYTAFDTIIATAGANGSITPTGLTTLSYGANQRFIFTPAANYHADSLFVDGVRNIDSLTGYTFKNVSSNHTIRVTFRINQFAISASSGANGSIAPAGAVVVTYGGSQRFSFTPSTGYHIDSVFIDGIQNIDSLAGYTFTNVTTNHTVRVTFKIIQFTITASGGSNGSIAPAGAVIVNYAASQRFLFPPASGYHADSLFVDGVRNTDSLGGYTFADIVANHTIRVTFRLNQYTITAASGPNGSIAPSGSIAVLNDSSQTFTFTPFAGYHVDSVLVDGGYIGSPLSYQFQHVVLNHSITVRFAIDRFTIAVTAGLHGTVAPAGGVYDYGTNPLFKLSPDTGYYVDSIVVDGVYTGDDTSYQFFNLNANHTLAVTFVSDSISVTVAQHWNLISLPMKFRDSRRVVLFPSSNSEAFAYNGAYAPVDTLRGSVGYWLRFPAAQTIPLRGKFRKTDTIGVQQGWNLIGTIAPPEAVNSIVSLPSGVVTSKFYSFAGNYIPVDTLRPGQGYWVKVSADAELILSTSPGSGAAGKIHVVDDGEHPPSPPGGQAVGKRMPLAFSLAAAYPNPFNPSTTIRYELPSDGHISLTVYTILGEVVNRLVDADQPAGYYDKVWNAGSMPSGIYFYRLTATAKGAGGNYTAVKKVLLMK